MTSARIFKTLLGLLVILAIAALGHYVYYNTFFRLDLNRQAQHEAQSVVESAFLMCQGTDRKIHDRADELHRQVVSALAACGQPSYIGDARTWSITKPPAMTGELLKLPALRLLGPEGQVQELSLLGESLGRLTGGHVTILQRINPEWDQLRVFCSRGGIGGPGDGTSVVPSSLDGGERESCLSELSRGRAVLRPELIQGELHLAYYHPLQVGDRVAGVILILLEDARITRLRQELISLRVGETGYVYALKATGADRGQYIISHQGERDGENIWHSADAAGRPFIQRMTAEALALRERRERISVPVAFERYPWKNPGETKARSKTVAVAYFEPWDWVLGAGYYEDEH